jgi:hypothetical protein
MGFSIGRDAPALHRAVRADGPHLLVRLAAEWVIYPCDPDIVAARIKRADRRPQG